MKILLYKGLLKIFYNLQLLSIMHSTNQNYPISIITTITHNYLNAEPQPLIATAPLGANVIDAKYVYLRRFGCSKEHMKMVFLVHEIESNKQYVMKFFTQAETDSYLDEIERNYSLVSSLFVQKAIKHVGAQMNMDPFIIDGIVYDFYSYIILPYCSKGTLLDLLIAANNRNEYFSISLQLYLMKQFLLCL